MPYIKQSNLKQIMLAGNLMSNICYNSKQNKELPSQLRASMEQAQQRWDNVKNLAK